MKKNSLKILKILIPVVLIICLLKQQYVVFASTISINNLNTEKTQIIVKFKDDIKGEETRKNIKGKLKLKKLNLLKKMNKSKIELLEIDISDDIDEVVNEFKNDSNVKYIQPNYRLNMSLDNTDVRPDITKIQPSGTKLSTFESLINEINVGYDINILKAWEMTKGSPDIVIGVLDSGISITNKDLIDNIYTNKKEIPNNKIDDDNNGVVDDLNGWDFVNNDNSIEDQDIGIHGTHIAGIIAAEQNNRGICGIAPNVKILPLKFMKNEYGYTSDAIDAIEYAKSIGVKIINCSWGSKQYNPALKEEMENSSDILFICSAGNFGQDVMSNPVYPACFDLPNILSVAATDKSGNLTNFSNYGQEIDLAAPGVDVLSTLPCNSYDKLSGSSMSAAYVTGVAALLKSYIPQMSTSDIKQTIKANVTKVKNLEGKVNTGGIIDAYNSLKNTKLGSIPSTEYNNDPINSEPIADNLNVEMSDFRIANPLKYDKYNSGQYTKDISEDVQKTDGSLNLNQDLLNLKGRNGLDLNLNLLYDSSKANLYDMNFTQNYKFQYSRYYFNFRSYLPVDPLNWMYIFTYNGNNYFTTVEPGGVVYPPYSMSSQTCVEDSEANAYINYNIYREFWINGGNNSDPIFKYNVTKLMSYGDVTVNYDSCTNTINDSTYLNKTCDIGAGWNWGFSSIETSNGYKYLHLSNNSVYKINMTSTTDDSNLENYTLKDIHLENDAGSYSNGIISSAYALFYKDGKKEYFDNDGKLIGIADRFNNTIKLEYSGTKISKITDTVGREITFNYSQGTGNKTLTISLSDTGSSSIVLTSNAIAGYSNKYVLQSIKDLADRSTTFDYEIDAASFNFFSRQSTAVVAQNNIYAKVKTVNYPTAAYTSYTYEKTAGNLGNSGIQEYWRIRTRKDSTNGKDYKSRTYNYSTNNYTGYPNNTDPSSLPTEYSFSTDVIDGLNNYVTYNFDNRNLLKSEVNKENVTNVKSSKTFNYDSNKMISSITNNTYDIASGMSIVKTENYYYDNYADLIYYWDPQANGDTNNTEHKTTYSYNSNYHYMLSKTYKKDQDTKIKEEFIPFSSDQRMIEYAKIWENDVNEKKRTQYGYDAYGNVIEEHNYKDDLATFISQYYSYLDNDNSRGHKFDGAYLTRKWTTGVKNADGVNETAKIGNDDGLIDENYKYDWFGNLKEKQDGMGNTTKFDYDKLSRVTKQTNPDSNATFKSLQYITNSTENSVTKTDENTNILKYFYDGFGNLLFEKDSSNNILNSYTYDSEFRMQTESSNNSNSNGRITTYHYFNDGRTEYKEIKDNYTNTIISREDFVYNDAFDYDNNGTADYEKITKTVKGDLNSPNIIISTYTNKLDQVEKQERQHIQNSITKKYTDTFVYNYLGNKTQEKLSRAYDEPATYPSCDYTTKYDYNYAGKVIKTTNADGKYSTTQYDTLGREVSVTDFKFSTTNYFYDNLNRLIKEVIPFEGTYTTIKKHYYDRNGNIVSEKVSNSKPGDTTVSDSRIDYAYNSRNMLMLVTSYCSHPYCCKK